MTNLPFDYEPLTPEDMEEIDEALQSLEELVLDKRQQIMEDKINFMAAGGGMTPEYEAAYRQQQAAEIQMLDKMESQISNLTQKIEDTILVLNARLFERAKVIHQAFREASKTNPDPALKQIVEELDALYEDAKREQGEDDAAA
ncbi:MAG: hypothetical protein SFU99_16795 [Saprospiraceae bacterium]|nr:hypothetical protein [Saprospiraceae bacterium]